MHLQGGTASSLSSPLDVAAVVKGMPWYGDSSAGAELGRRACQADALPMCAWELNTALEAIDVMLSPWLPFAEDDADVHGQRSDSQGAAETPD